MKLFKLLDCRLIFIFFLLSFIFSESLFTKMIMEDVEYKDGETVLQGFIAYDDSIKVKRPGVLIVHEWNGLGTFVTRRAEQIAKLGYIAFCIDMYGKNIRPKNVEESSKQATIYRSDRNLMRRRANAGLEYFKKQEMVDPNRIAAIGYCFGGGTVLELARSGADIIGVVSFHGNLDTPNPEDGKNIKAKVLVLHGANDPYTTPGQMGAFQKEMKDADIDWQLYIYGGAVHAFTNPDSGNNPASGAAYNERADKRSWDAMRLFFNEIF